MVKDAGGLLRAAAGERAEDHLHQVLSVCAPHLSQPGQHLLQQELYSRICHFNIVLLLTRCYFFIQFHQRLDKHHLRTKCQASCHCMQQLQTFTITKTIYVLV